MQVIFIKSLILFKDYYHMLIRFVFIYQEIPHTFQVFIGHVSFVKCFLLFLIDNIDFLNCCFIIPYIVFYRLQKPMFFNFLISIDWLSMGCHWKLFKLFFVYYLSLLLSLGNVTRISLGYLHFGKLAVRIH